MSFEGEDRQDHMIVTRVETQIFGSSVMFEFRDYVPEGKSRMNILMDIRRSIAVLLGTDVSRVRAESQEGNPPRGVTPPAAPPAPATTPPAPPASANPANALALAGSQTVGAADMKSQLPYDPSVTAYVFAESQMPWNPYGEEGGWVTVRGNRRFLETVNVGVHPDLERIIPLLPDYGKLLRVVMSGIFEGKASTYLYQLGWFDRGRTIVFREPVSEVTESA